MLPISYRLVAGVREELREGLDDLVHCRTRRWIVLRARVKELHHWTGGSRRQHRADLHFDHVVNYPYAAPAVVRRPRSDELVQEDAKRVDIACQALPPLDKALRRHVGDRPGKHPRHMGFVVVQQQSKPKVRHLQKPAEMSGRRWSGAGHVWFCPVDICGKGHSVGIQPAPRGESERDAETTFATKQLSIAASPCRSRFPSRMLEALRSPWMT